MNESWDWPGARWWRVDLHAHSPMSYDFKPQRDDQYPEKDDPCWARWVTAVQDAGIQAVAITDHNTAGAVTYLKDAVKDMAEKGEEYGANYPVIFPGVELTASGGIHLLLLMDPRQSQDHVEDVLSRLGLTVDKRGKRSGRTSKSVEEILEECEEGTLVVGAHVNGPKGLFKLTGQDRIAVLDHPNLAAVEINPDIQDEGDLELEDKVATDQNFDHSWLDGSKPQIEGLLPQVWASDGHRYHKLGQRFTWVKMTRPNFEGLRLALLDGKDSLKPARRGGPGGPNTHPPLAFESITINNSKFIGRSEPMMIAFNPWLNTIIGGRGTGKSTIVDFIRMTMRREQELGDSNKSDKGSLRDQFNRRLHVPANRNEEGLLTEDTRIDVIYRKDRKRFKLSWSTDGSAEPIFYIAGDQQQAEEGDIRERFPVRIYSQKQLFQLAQDPNALLTVIDDSRDVNRADLDRSIENKRARYLSLCAEIRSVSKQLDKLPARRAALTDIQHRQETIQASGHVEAMREFRIRHQQDDTWRLIHRNALQDIKSIEDMAEDINIADLNFAISAKDDPKLEGVESMHNTLESAVDEFKRSIQEVVRETCQVIEEIPNGTDATQWGEIVKASKARFNRSADLLAKEGLSSTSEYEDLLRQAIAARRSIEELEREEKHLESLVQDSKKVLNEYRCLREQLSKRRKAFVKRSSSEMIDIKIEPCANHSDLKRDLSEIFGIPHFELDRQAVAQKIRPEPGNPWDWKRLDNMVKAIRQFQSEELSSWKAQDSRFNVRLKGIPPERIDRLALYSPEDSVIISVSLGKKTMPIGQGSPGQQTAALLTFVLGYGDEPIILDQPEDDLDNTVIYDLLVKQLRKIKLNRQVIIVTHNANIVVNGDAELVFSLHEPYGQSLMRCQGGLQEQKVRSEICHVMEGGREAFESRYRRIMQSQKAAL